MRILGTIAPEPPLSPPPVSQSPSHHFPDAPLHGAYAIWRARNPSLHDWVHALVLVAFDIKRGQVIEAVAPPHALSADELNAICFCSMPDSVTGGPGAEDVFYTFRVPRDDALLLAHTLFRQRPDPSSARGFFQKALVVVTSLSSLALPEAVLQTLAEDVFERGGIVLEEAMQNVSAWPSVDCEQRELRLRLGASWLHVSLPQSFPCSFAAPAVSVEGGALPVATPEDMKQVKGGVEDVVVRRFPLCMPSVSMVSVATVALFNEIGIATALRGVHEKIYTLWELVALGEPILVHGCTPSQCAAAVMAIVGLMHPLPYVGDWRPYFCMHDAGWTEIAGGSKEGTCRDGCVYGVTNVHLLEKLRFPNVLTLKGVEGIGKGGKVGLETSHKPSLYRSKQLKAALATAVAEGERKDGKVAACIAADVRACVFNRITRPFLRAFDRYLVPTWGGGRPVTEEPYASDPFGRKLGLLQLDLDNFPSAEDLTSPGLVKLFRPGTISRNRIKTLYKRFVAGSVFKAWWKSTRAAAERECAVLHRTDLIEACVRGVGWITRGSSSEDMPDAGLVDRIVDLCLRIQEELKDAEADDHVLREKLEGLSEPLMNGLPEDVSRAIQKSWRWCPSK